MDLTGGAVPQRANLARSCDRNSAHIDPLEARGYDVDPGGLEPGSDSATAVSAWRLDERSARRPR
jgi:hypothetical protein